jgi:large subunit ribosomal protein L7/L12
MALDIASIKEQLSGATILELKTLIDDLKETWGVTAMVAAGPAVGGGAAAAAPVEEQTEFDVVLKSVDAAKKIGVIKEVRAITGLGLAEAKALTENGGNIKEAVNKEDAQKFKKQLEDAGAVVELK